MTFNDLRNHTKTSGNPERLKLGTILLYMGYLYLQTTLEYSYYCIILHHPDIIEKSKEYARMWSRKRVETWRTRHDHMSDTEIIKEIIKDNGKIRYLWIHCTDKDGETWDIIRGTLTSPPL